MPKQASDNMEHLKRLKGRHSSTPLRTIGTCCCNMEHTCKTVNLYTHYTHTLLLDKDPSASAEKLGSRVSYARANLLEQYRHMLQKHPCITSCVSKGACFLSSGTILLYYISTPLLKLRCLNCKIFAYPKLMVSFVLPL